ncbi:MAG: sensor histidine kinase [Desulfovibrio sp.]|uniref:sensor histidine kinase n=1 Tax=Desulfovibrio sp. 7SRBS1 TaxID=3378064 RepID=UPI003B41E0AD
MHDYRDTATESPFQLIKLISWSFLILILGFNLALSMFVAEYAQRTLLEKQKEYARLLAENLNHQIFRRFTLPTLLGIGDFDLRSKEQYAQIDNVIRATIHSFHVLNLRVYGFDETVSYSLEKEEVGADHMADKAVSDALKDGTRTFEIINKDPIWKALLTYKLAPESVILRTVFVLRTEKPFLKNDMNYWAVELTQDITGDYQTAINFQRLIVITSLFSSLLLFFVLVLIIRRADRVTQERAREKEQLERELHQSEKLASMGRMVSGVAHEIRNPLGIIRSSAEHLLSKATRNNDPSAPLLQAIFSESKRLSRTVNDFLDYARPKQPRQDDVNLASVLDQGTTFLESRCRETGVTLQRRYPKELHIHGDKDLLYRAFYNLLANALEAMEAERSGPEKSGQDAHGAESILRVTASQSRDSLTLVVQDTGPGFDPDVLDQVKDPFFTTKDTGTGLGLAIVNNIFQAHGARMVLENASTGGARISVTFPKN